MRSGCRGFESRSGHLIFSSICSVYIDRHIRVDLSDDEQQVSPRSRSVFQVRRAEFYALFTLTDRIILSQESVDKSCDTSEAPL